MYKVGVRLMGRPETSVSKVKEIVLEVEPKTKIKNVFEYLAELDKIRSSNVYMALEKGGRGVS